MKYQGTLEAHSSNRDRAGNCYWAVRYTDHATGKVAQGIISGGESNIYAVRQHWDAKGWDESVLFQTQSHKIRDFDRMVKDWPYAGCAPEEIAAFLKKAIGKS